MTDKLRQAAEMALETMKNALGLHIRWDEEAIPVMEALRQALAEPPKREWQGLTDDEIAEAVGSPLDEVYLTDFRRVEAKLKEKNGF